MTDQIPDTPLDLFRRLGEQASFHFADDSTKEWNLGDAAVKRAIEIYLAAPKEEQAEMDVVARGFLWSLSIELDKCYKKGT